MLKKILVIRWSGMGDIVMTLPALKWLKQRFAFCEIFYLTDPAFAEIPKMSGLVAGVETIDRHEFANPHRGLAPMAGAIACLRRLRCQHLDMAFDLQGFSETALLAALSGAPARIGRVKNSTLRARLYNRPIRADWEHEHRTRYFLRAVAEGCGSTVAEKTSPPMLSLPQNQWPSPRPVGLNIGTTSETRRWPEDHFFSLASRLSETGVPIRIFIGPRESFLQEKAAVICAEKGWQLSCPKRMQELAEALSQCALIVSNDTGPGHLAAAVGTPVITLFSTGDPENVRPLAAKARWFRDKDAIDRIPVAAVHAACLEILTETGSI